jgi:hypothetical protein
VTKLIGAVTDFDQLAFNIEKVAEETGASGARGEAPASGPFSPHHFVLLWLLEREIVIDGIDDAGDAAGYATVRLRSRDYLDVARFQELLAEMAEFHQAKLLSTHAGEATDDGDRFQRAHDRGYAAHAAGTQG